MYMFGYFVSDMLAIIATFAIVIVFTFTLKYLHDLKSKLKEPK